MHGDYKTEALSLFNFLKAATLSLVTLSVERFLWLLKKYWWWHASKEMIQHNDGCHSPSFLHIETPPICTNQLFEITFWTRRLCLNQHQEVQILWQQNLPTFATGTKDIHCLTRKGIYCWHWQVHYSLVDHDNNQHWFSWLCKLHDQKYSQKHHENLLIIEQKLHLQPGIQTLIEVPVLL